MPPDVHGPGLFSVLNPRKGALGRHSFPLLILFPSNHTALLSLMCSGLPDPLQDPAMREVMCGADESASHYHGLTWSGLGTVTTVFYFVGKKIPET